MTGSRRDFLRTSAALGAALAWPLTTVGAPARAWAQGDKQGGLLRISATFGLSTLNPLAHISGAEWMATRWLYSNLTRLTPKRDVVPDLAESWTGGDGGRVWTFKLRRGVQFHVGREVVADDVVATMQTILDPKTASPYRGEIGPIDRVEAVDKWTVRFTLRGPFADFPAIMTVPVARIVAREGLGEVTAALARAVSATRPAVLVSNATLPDQRSVSGPLSDIAWLADREGIPAPATLIVGDVVAASPFLAAMNEPSRLEVAL